MTDTELSALILDKDSFFNTIRKDATVETIKGRFKAGKKPYLFVLTLEDGSTITLKFVDTVKYLLDHKMRKIHGRDSFLSYLEITAQANGQKAYSRNFDIKQVCIGVPREVSEAKHLSNLEKLKEKANAHGIDLSNQDSWSKTYFENYRDLK